MVNVGWLMCGVLLAFSGGVIFGAQAIMSSLEKDCEAGLIRFGDRAFKVTKT